MKRLLTTSHLPLASIFALLFLVSCSDKTEWINYLTSEDLISSSSEEISSSSEEFGVSSSSEEYNSSSSAESSSSMELLSSSSEVLSSSSSEVSSSSSVVLDGCENYQFGPTSSDFCFKGNIYSKCGGTEYIPETQICINNSYATAAICNGTAYSPLIQDCCVNTIFERSNQRCENNIVETKCGEEWYNASSHFCFLDNETYKKCNGIEYNPEEQFCYEDSKVGNKCGNRPDIYNPDEYGCKSINPNIIYLKTKPQDNAGNEYDAVLIGEQIWMAQDLSSEAGGVCPTGWHIPTADEWNTLIELLGSSPGKHLKATSGWQDCGTSDSDIFACEDTFGFAALPSDGNYIGYWLINPIGYVFMEFFTEQVGVSSGTPGGLYNIRCVRASE